MGTCHHRTDRLLCSQPLSPSHRPAFAHACSQFVTRQEFEADGVAIVERRCRKLSSLSLTQQRMEVALEASRDGIDRSER